MAVTGEIIRAALQYSAPNCDAAYNIFHWIIFAGSPTDAQLANDFEEWFTNNWGAAVTDVMASSAQLVDVALDIVDVEDEVVRSIGTIGLGIPGTQSGGVPGAAMSGFLWSAKDVGKGRPCKYVPFVGEPVVTDNEFVTAAISALLQAAVWWIVDIVAGGVTYTPGIVQLAPPAFVGMASVANVAVEPAYQRRRKFGS